MNLSRFPYTFVIASCAVLPATRSDRTLHPRDASNRIHAQSRTAGNFTFVEQISPVQQIIGYNLPLLKNDSDEW